MIKDKLPGPFPTVGQWLNCLGGVLFELSQLLGALPINSPRVKVFSFLFGIVRSFVCAIMHNLV